MSEREREDSGKGTIANLLPGLVKLNSTILFLLPFSLNSQKTYLNGREHQNNGSVCKQEHYQGTETGFIHLWMQMARMEMDCNLKKIANFFKSLRVFWKNCKMLIRGYSPLEKSFHIFLPVLLDQFRVRKEVLSQIAFS